MRQTIRWAPLFSFSSSSSLLRLGICSVSWFVSLSPQFLMWYLLTAYDARSSCDVSFFHSFTRQRMDVRGTGKEKKVRWGKNFFSFCFLWFLWFFRFYCIFRVPFLCFFFSCVVLLVVSCLIPPLHIFSRRTHASVVGLNRQVYSYVSVDILLLNCIRIISSLGII